MSLPKAVLLDRDGVINFDSPGYILTPEQWQPIPGSLEAIARLCAHAIPVAIVSNQSALGRGMVDRKTFNAIHARMMAAIKGHGGHIAHVAYCPHAPADDCECRKPKPGLVLDTLTRLGLADRPSSVLLVGDSMRDIKAAIAAGVRPALVRTGYGDVEEIYRQARRLDHDIQIYPDLRTVVETLLREA